MYIKISNFVKLANHRMTYIWHKFQSFWKENIKRAEKRSLWPEPMPAPGISSIWALTTSIMAKSRLNPTIILIYEVVGWKEIKRKTSIHHQSKLVNEQLSIIDHWISVTQYKLQKPAKKRLWRQSQTQWDEIIFEAALFFRL